MGEEKSGPRQGADIFAPISKLQRQADYAWTVLMRLISHARARGLTSYRPPERIEPLYRGDRSQRVWDERHIADFMGVASEPLQRATGDGARNRSAARRSACSDLVRTKC